MNRKFLPLFFLLFLYLFRFPQSAANGIRSGLILWYTSVIPTLFPFMLISNLILQFHLTKWIPQRLTWPLRTVFCCSHAGALAILIGFLCGFPLGAKICFDLEQTGQISKKERDFLFPFVNNPSPGFILSYLAAEQLHMKSRSFLLVISILGASALYGILYAFFRKKSKKETFLPVLDSVPASKTENGFSVIDHCIYDTIQNTLRLGGYILCFSLLSEAASQLVFFEHPVLLCFCASIELTKGIAMLCDTKWSAFFQLLLAQALTSFGGLSAAVQTAGICSLTGKEFTRYLKSRMIITLLSILITICCFIF